ncbi:MAG: formylglycine-generating enzyme family protein [Thermogutta sp.]
MRQKGLSRWCLLALGCLIVVGTTVRSEECGAGKPNPAEDFVIKWLPEPYPVPDADAKTESEMKPYTEVIVGTDIKFDMVPIPGGKFIMGSPENEAGRKEDEGPQHEVEVEPFWMAKYETLWDAYETWSFELDKRRREQTKEQATKWDEIADAIARPTPPYTDMSFGMGKKDRPAVCMTLYAAQHFCKWLSAKTGRYYRLPTEAEWEYACRAGTKTAYSFGNNPDDLEDYGWFFDNADDKYHKVGEKKPNPWGLYDMHGNVAEWVLDQYVADAYKQFAGKTVKNPLVPATKEFPVVVRGGSWMDDPEMLRSAARRGSHPDWKMQDPQIPQSIWYLTDAPFVGFRVIRPLRLPTEEEAKLYEPDPEILRNYRKAQGGKQ